MFRNMSSSYSEELLVPNLTPKLRNTSLADRDGVFPATLIAWRPFLHLQQEDAPSCNSMPNVFKFAIQKYKY